MQMQSHEWIYEYAQSDARTYIILLSTHIHMHTYTYIRTCTHIYIDADAHTQCHYVYTHTDTQTHTQRRTHTLTDTQTHTQTDTHIHRQHIHTHTSTHTHITHTHTHTPSFFLRFASKDMWQFLAEYDMNYEAVTPRPAGMFCTKQHQHTTVHNLNIAERIRYCTITAMKQITVLTKWV